MRTLAITIVTPWQNHRELERDFFDAIRCIDAELVIVDDHSDPPLPNAIRSVKHGFSPACNAGLDVVQTEAVLFLNNDIVARERDWIEPIREALEDGVLVGAQLRYDQHGMVDEEPMPYIDGWCLAGMTEDIRELGAWDESYAEPSYYGDNDLCFRARMAGMTLREARVPVEHLLNRTVGPHDTQIRLTALANKAKFESHVRDALGVAA